MSEVVRNYPGRLKEISVDANGQQRHADHVYKRPREQEPYVLDNNGRDLEKQAQHLVGRAAKATEQMDSALAVNQEMITEGDRRARELGGVAWRSVWSGEELEKFDTNNDVLTDGQDKVDMEMWRAFVHYRDNPNAYYEAALDEDLARTEKKAIESFDPAAAAETLTQNAAEKRAMEDFDPVAAAEAFAREATEKKD
jgi:hypothetical protein